MFGWKNILLETCSLLLLMVLGISASLAITVVGLRMVSCKCQPVNVCKGGCGDCCKE